MRKVLVALVVAVLVAMAGPAQASGAIAWRVPGHPAVVQIQAPHNAKWAASVRRVAAYYDSHIAGFKVYRYGTCASHPHATCYVFRVRNYGRWGGLWGATGQRSGYRLTRFNTYYGYSQHIVCHEMGHGFGQTYHDTDGCISNSNWSTLPSGAELRRFNAAY